MELGRRTPGSSALSERAGLAHAETKNGFPVISASNYERLYNTDVREAGQDAVLTFNYRGYVRFDAPGYVPGVYYKDALATNGLLKDNDQPGIHVGTDGIVDYGTLLANHRMLRPEDVREYDIYIKIPGTLQKKLAVVCKYDSCLSLKEALDGGFNKGEIEGVWNASHGWIVIRTHLKPTTDPLARAKVEVIHDSIVKFIERGGGLNEIESLVQRLETALAEAKPQEIARRLGKTEEEIFSAARAVPVTGERGVDPIGERLPSSVIRLNDRMLDRIRRKYDEYGARLNATRQDTPYMAPELGANMDDEIRDALYKAYIARHLMNGEARRDVIMKEIMTKRTDFNQAQFDNAWNVIDAYNRDDLRGIRGGSGL